jgi:CsoR family transcriptional regulator, copper-sensing transcriptional repressor
MSLCGTDHKKIIDRLNRIEGQVKGIRKMVEEDRPCMDVLKQTAAAAGAMRSVGMVLLENHLKGCVADALSGQCDDRDETLNQVLEVFQKFSK